MFITILACSYLTMILVYVISMLIVSGQLLVTKRKIVGKMTKVLDYDIVALLVPQSFPVLFMLSLRSFSAHLSLSLSLSL